MILKESDKRQDDVAVLEYLLGRPDVSARTKDLIAIELAKVKAGVRGESAAAYEIDRLFESRDDYIVIHDLRIEIGDQVAQIDHFIVSRTLYSFVCETKNFGEGLGCNAYGEWVGFRNGKPFGIASPVLQARRQADILQTFFEPGHDWHPKKIGTYIGVFKRPVVLISNTARISRPKTAVDGLENVFKIEALKTKQAELEKEQDFLTRKLRAISSEALETFGRGVLAAHKPIVFDWFARFGIPVHPLGDNFERAKVGGLFPAPFVGSVGMREEDTAQASLPFPAAPESDRARELQAGSCEASPFAPSDSARHVAISMVSFPGPVVGDKAQVPSSKSQPGAKKKLICDACSASISFAEGRFCWGNPRRFKDGTYCRTCQKTF